MDAWYRLRIGGRLKAVETEELAHVLPTLFGYHLMQIGLPGEADWLGSSRIRHRIILDNVCRSPERFTSGTQQVQSSVMAASGALPIDSDSVDVVVLPHILEFEKEPHQVLREVERVLIPEGHVVILGFNPFSWWGIWRQVARWKNEAPWCGRFYSMTRIRDWLALLGFDTVTSRCYFFHPTLRGRRLWPGLGSGYLLVAKKRVTTLTPIRPRWKRRRRFLPGGVTEPLRFTRKR